METKRRCGHIAVIYKYKLFIWGGYYTDVVANHEVYIDSKTLSIYNIKSGSWKDVKLKTSDEYDENYPYPLCGSSATRIGCKCYIFGGYSPHLSSQLEFFLNQGSDNQLYCLDLKDCTWNTVYSESGPLPSFRNKHSSFSFKDILYIFGGFGPEPRKEGDYEIKGDWVRCQTNWLQGCGWNNHLFAFNVLRNTWYQPSVKGEIPCPRAAHATTVLNEKAFVFGGRFQNERMNDFYCLDLDVTELTWTRLHSSISFGMSSEIPDGRSWHSLNKVSDDKLMLYGGFTTNERVLGDAWIFNLKTKCWSKINVLAGKARLWHTACTLIEGHGIIVFGGCQGNILTDAGTGSQCEDIFEIDCCPKSLVRLCLDIIVVYFKRLEGQIITLPKILIKELNQRTGSVESCNHR